MALMCDLCYERPKNTKEPACSPAGPTRCLLWGDLKALSEGIERRLLERLSAFLGKPGSHFKGFFAVFGKDLLAPPFFLLDIEKVRNHL